MTLKRNDKPCKGIEGIDGQLARGVKKVQNEWDNSGRGSGTRRTILFVDNDAYADALRDVWSQLRLTAELRVASTHEKALSVLRDASKESSGAPLAAIVLDPEVTGEATGSFLREVQDAVTKHGAAVVLWTRDIAKYGILEGRGADSVLQKPMFLRLIRALDEACRPPAPGFPPTLGDGSARGDQPV